MSAPLSPANARLGRASAGFAMAAGITVLFNTALAWVKDAYRPLTGFMNALTGNNWVTHALADVILFIVLGLIFTKTKSTERIAPNSLILFLLVAVVAAGVGLFAWYAVF